MGLNSYFAYQVIGIRGSGLLPWRSALTAVFLEGWIFIILSLTGLRHWLVRIIPSTMKVAGVCGIGLFLALNGLANNTGLGLITSGDVVPISLADCSNPDQQGQCSGVSAIADPKVMQPDRSSFFVILTSNSYGSASLEGVSYQRF